MHEIKTLFTPAPLGYTPLVASDINRHVPLTWDTLAMTLKYKIVVPRRLFNVAFVNDLSPLQQIAKVSYNVAFYDYTMTHARSFYIQR